MASGTQTPAGSEFTVEDVDKHAEVEPNEARRKRGRPKLSKNQTPAQATTSAEPDNHPPRRPPGRPPGTGSRQRERARLAERGLAAASEPLPKRGPGRPRKQVFASGSQVKIDFGHFVSLIILTTHLSLDLSLTVLRALSRWSQEIQELRKV